MSKIIRTYTCETAIPNRRQVKPGSVDGKVALATSSTDLIIGVSDCPGDAAIGDRIDIVLFGETEVDVGGTVGFGAYITADANGKAIAAAPAAGVNARTGGLLHQGAAVSGDIAKAFVNPNRIQG